MSPNLGGSKRESGTARILGSGTSGERPPSLLARLTPDLCLARLTSRRLTMPLSPPGIAELMVFHPVDTIAKRLMTNKDAVRPASLSRPLVQQLPWPARTALSAASLIPPASPRLATSSFGRRQITRANVKDIIFRKHANAPVGQKFLSLFPGLGYAAGYKVAQRVYKFGGQPWFRDMIQKHDGGFFVRAFGEKKGKMIREAAAGSCVPPAAVARCAR